MVSYPNFRAFRYVMGDIKLASIGISKNTEKLGNPLMSRRNTLRLSFLFTLAVAMGCTRLKAVTTADASPSPSPSASASTDALATFPSPSPTPVPPSPTPVPTPQITLAAPGTGQDFTASSVDISFTAQAPAGRKIASATVLYNGNLLTTIKGEGPLFKVQGWNPNVANNLQDKPDTTPVPHGDKTLTILATDDNDQTGKLEFAFRKPLEITGWSEMTAMPGPTSHFAIFGDGAQPPAFVSLWGSVDGIESTVFPRQNAFTFNPGGAGSWTTGQLNGSSIPRAGYGWALHSNGQIAYIVGGRTGQQDLRTLDVFSPLRKVAEQSLSVMTNARRDAAAVFTADNYLYAIGGKSGDTPMYSVERVQIGSDGNPVGDWTPMADTQNARAGATAIQQGKQIWVFGGGFRPIETYDPDANSWSFLTGPDGTVIGTPEAWSNSLMVPMGDRVYFFGGEKEDGTPVGNIYEFNPAARSWRTVGPLPSSNVIPAAEIGSTRLGGFFLADSFYIMGGQSLPGRAVTQRVFKGTTL